MIQQCLEETGRPGDGGEAAMEERLQEAWRGAGVKMSPEEPFTPMSERSQLPPQLQLLPCLLSSGKAMEFSKQWNARLF